MRSATLALADAEHVRAVRAHDDRVARHQEPRRSAARPAGRRAPRNRSASPAPLIAMRTSIMRDLSSPTGTIARILLALLLRGAVHRDGLARGQVARLRDRGARHDLDVFRVGQAHDFRARRDELAELADPLRHVPGERRADRRARDRVARAVARRARLRRARGAPSRGAPPPRRSGSSRRCRPGSALSRASCVSSSSAFAASREICASFSRELQLERTRVHARERRALRDFRAGLGHPVEAARSLPLRAARRCGSRPCPSPTRSSRGRAFRPRARR